MFRGFFVNQDQDQDQEGALRDLEATQQQLKESIERSRELVDQARRQLEEFSETGKI